MSHTEIKRTRNQEEEEGIEIRLSDIKYILKRSRKSILYWGLGFFCVGFLYAFSQKNEYTAVVKIMPELKSAASGLGDLRSLASLAGVSLGGANGTSEAIRPDLYPDVIQSVPFSLYLLNQPVISNSAKTTQTLQTYLTEPSGEGITGVLQSLFGGNNKGEEVLSDKKSPDLQLTLKQEQLCRLINTQVVAEMDKKSGIITITCRMPDPKVSATVARLTLNYLTTYVTNYRTGKARQQVDFLTEQVNNSRRRYQEAENLLSAYRDRNRNLFLNTAKIEEQRLQADYILAQSVYSELAKQLEQARIKVQEESPVFQVLEPPRVPLRKSGPKRMTLIIGFTIFGIVVGLAAFLVRYFIPGSLKKAK